MNEAEIIGALSDIADSAGTFLGMWISLKFAYLTAAYIVGRAMSRFQCWVVTSLYFVTAFFIDSAAFVHTQAWIKINESQSLVYSHLWVAPYDLGAAIFLAVGTLVLLYFMYNVRYSESS